MDAPQVACGFLRGTGAALNVPLGWIPDFVLLLDLTNGNIAYMNAIPQVIAFTSGGTEEIKAGDKIHGNTSDAVATVRQVIIDSGSWVGGGAAGWFIIERDEAVGTFSAGETAYRDGVDSDGDNYVTLTHAANQDGVDIDTTLAETTTDATNVYAYAGASGSAPKGFTVGGTASVNAALMYFVAFRGDAMLDFTAAP